MKSRIHSRRFDKQLPAKRISPPQQSTVFLVIYANLTTKLPPSLSLASTGGITYWERKEATAPPPATATGYSRLPQEPHQVTAAQLTSMYAGLKLLDQDLIPEGTVPGNPTPSGQCGMISLVRGGSWPEAKEEKRVIQTHHGCPHPFPGQGAHSLPRS